MAKGGEVNVDMEDHKDEEYKPVKRKMAAFSGGYRSLVMMPGEHLTFARFSASHLSDYYLRWLDQSVKHLPRPVVPNQRFADQLAVRDKVAGGS